MKVILDTNFLMIPGKFHVDIFEELKKLINVPYEIVVFEGTIEELKKLSSGNGNDKVLASVALELIKQKNLKTLKNSSKIVDVVDDMIVAEVQKNPKDYTVCTQDKALKQRIRELKARIITLKSEKHLDYEV